MARRVVLHIGTMKSGTSYLQAQLTAQRGTLGEHGVQVLGGNRRGNGLTASHGAAKDLISGAAELPRWQAVAAKARASSADTVVISSEFFGFLRKDAIRRAIDDLEGLEVCVVLGVRDQLTAIAAQWQSHTRNTGRTSFAEYLRLISAPGQGDSSRARHTFHRSQDVPRVLSRWADAGVDRLAALTVPPRGAPPAELWQRFAAAALLPEHVEAATAVPSNPSLGYESCTHLVRLNPLLDGLPKEHYKALTRPLAVEALLPLRDAQGSPRLDRSTAAWALERNQAAREALARPAVVLAGDPTDLPVEASLDAWPEEVPAPDEELVRASAVAGLRHAAERAGAAEAETPGTVPEILSETARLLRAVPTPSR